MPARSCSPPAQSTQNAVGLRVLICTPWYAPARAFGGTVTVAVATAKGLLDAGHGVTVATSDALDLQARVPPGTPPEPTAAEVFRFRNLSRRLAGTNVVLPRGLRSWLRRHVREFDVVLLLDVYSSVSVLGSRAAAEAGIPYVLEALGTLPATAERGRALPKRAFLALWGRRTVRDAAVCLYLSEDERQEYLAQGADAEQLKALARSLGVGDAVGFPGFLPEVDKPRTLAQAHVFALLSASEGLPVTPLEALACGTPVVLSPGCRLPEVDGVGGIVCDGTAEGAAAALSALLRDPERARELGESGRTFAAAYRREVVVPELVALLERVATSSRSAA